MGKMAVYTRRLLQLFRKTRQKSFLWFITSHKARVLAASNYGDQFTRTFLEIQRIWNGKSCWQSQNPTRVFEAKSEGTAKTLCQSWRYGTVCLEQTSCL